MLPRLSGVSCAGMTGRTGAGEGAGEAGRSVAMAEQFAQGGIGPGVLINHQSPQVRRMHSTRAGVFPPTASGGWLSTCDFAHILGVLSSQ